MAALSKYVKQRIVSLKERGLTNREVVAILKHEGDVVHVTTQMVRRCHKRYLETGSIAMQQGSGRPTMRTAALLQTIEDIMQADDEATAVQIRSYLLQQSQRLLSLSTILHVRRELGWTYRGSAYCQLIRQANKEKRLEWARAHLHDNFEDVLWTDESSVQLECHKRFCCRKEGEQPRPKPRAKHPVKVHVWAGIGWHGATKICFFDGIMDGAMYVRILQVALLPTLQRPEYEKGHSFMQDNDPKHTSRVAKAFFAENGVNWWRTPPESPDANPIENLWHELKISEAYSELHTYALHMYLSMI